MAHKHGPFRTDSMVRARGRIAMRRYTMSVVRVADTNPCRSRGSSLTPGGGATKASRNHHVQATLGRVQDRPFRANRIMVGQGYRDLKLKPQVNKHGPFRSDSVVRRLLAISLEEPVFVRVVGSQVPH